jgi:N-acetylmuramic acid 6-phosphate etherase
MKKITESNSLYNNLEKMGFEDLLKYINDEDRKVAEVITKSIPKISKLTKVIVEKLSSGGRLFYIGSGTSGRLGIVDASECPPTFGVSSEMVIGLIAGGDSAIRNSVEAAEDNENKAWEDLKLNKITEKDIVIGISASGTTPYVVGGLKDCQKNKIYTGCITCNKHMPISKYSNTAIELLVGPEFVTGSTRMKAGTAQKMTLNMLSTVTMIKLGHVLDNKMVDMQLKNNKLQNRGVYMIMEICDVNKIIAKELLTKHGNVRAAIKSFKNDSR